MRQCTKCGSPKVVRVDYAGRAFCRSCADGETADVSKIIITSVEELEEAENERLNRARAAPPLRKRKATNEDILRAIANETGIRIYQLAKMFNMSFPGMRPRIDRLIQAQYIREIPDKPQQYEITKEGLDLISE